MAAEHFIFADGSISVYLSMLYTSMLSHGYLPEEFTKSFIVPLIKNKTGDTSDKGNYRHVAIVSACSKLVLNVYCLASFKSTCARVTTNLGLRASIRLTYVYTH